MKENKTSAPRNESTEKANPRPIISRSRWTNRSTHPRLVSISWSGVARHGMSR